MAVAEATQAQAPKKTSKTPIFIGLVLALVGGGGGYYAATSGLLGIGESQAEAPHGEETDHEAPDHSGAASDPHDDGTATDHGDGSSTTAVGDLAFVPVDPLVISLGPRSAAHYLRFRAQLETPKKYRAEVQTLMPRVVDVLNSYLRAIEVADLQEPTILVRLRAQMLRRVQIVTGPGRVNDLLIMEFVLN
ncbi:flagellar basal body-associated FliL family protein [Thalassovita taeanensis]|uniref:Flagellar protein FliL n=1 Tax=Thalassovita taeanensis TaxID=657014 RepID=A0A1H9CL05_9RHOB|nr:flagellar basal body-associated FliL family protein [Thalassovita taeanensis]SEQ01393.1 flagellar FliL protein [Thalassovita taeanensis]